MQASRLIAMDGGYANYDCFIGYQWPLRRNIKEVEGEGGEGQQVIRLRSVALL